MIMFIPKPKHPMDDDGFPLNDSIGGLYEKN